MPSQLGRFILVLHTHLPYVIHHGHWPHGMEWLFEAASETYIPLLNALFELKREGKSPKLTISLTPVLTEQLAHPVFRDEFVKFLYEEIDRAEKDIAYFETAPKEKDLEPLAKFWIEHYRGILRDFSITYRHDLIGAFRELQDAGVLDIITCGATHGYFPLLGTDANIRAQIKTAAATHERHFGRKPRGIWLPECAYRPHGSWTPPVASPLGSHARLRPGIEQLLSEQGLEYFIVDSSLIAGGKMVPMYMGRFENLRALMQRLQAQQKPLVPPGEPQSVYEIYRTKSSPDATGNPVAIFARDVETSMQVWSSELGYPGGEWYLDFHKKHHQSGHRYWRVTSLHADLGLKTRYRPERTDQAIEEDVLHFIDSVKNALSRYRDIHGVEGTLTAPFDSELFGHWWFEGPEFLKRLLSKLADDPEIEIAHCAQAIDETPPHRTIAIPEGSWGAGGNHYVWFNHEVDWMWPFIYQDEYAMQRQVTAWTGSTDPEWTRIVKQMARELLLLESSDWPFLISTQSAIDYASKRFMEHHEAFNRLAKMAEVKSNGEKLSGEDRDWLETIVVRDDLFDESAIDPLSFLEND